MADEIDSKAAQAIDELVRAYKEASALVAKIPEPQRAFALATDLVNRLQAIYGEAGELRAQMVARIWEIEALSLAGLAKRVGISKTRADQLIRAAKTAKAKEG